MPLRAAQLTALKTDIGRRLTDPVLKVAILPARHGIRPHYLHWERRRVVPLTRFPGSFRGNLQA